MSELNPYSAPEAALSEPESDLRLGGRAERLGAAFADGLIGIALVLPMMYFLGIFSYMLRGQEPPFMLTLLSGVLGFAAFVAVQGYPLHRWGQTCGKRLLKLRIVDLEGKKPDLLRLLGFRYGSTQLIAFVPVLGPLYSLVDSLFIFREDRRCLHDHVAGTRVVVAD